MLIVSAPAAEGSTLSRVDLAWASRAGCGCGCRCGRGRGCGYRNCNDHQTIPLRRFAPLYERRPTAMVHDSQDDESEVVGDELLVHLSPRKKATAWYISGSPRG